METRPQALKGHRLTLIVSHMRSKANIAICSYFATRKTNIDNISPGDHFLLWTLFKWVTFLFLISLPLSHEARIS